MSGASEMPNLTGQPASLTAIASSLAQIAGTAKHTTVVSQGAAAKAISSTWGPKTHAARSAEVTKLGTKVKSAATALESMDRTLDGFGDDLSKVNAAITKLQREWDDLDAAFRHSQAAIQRDNYGLKDRDKINALRANDMSRLNNQLADERAKLKQQWAKLCVGANTAANTTAKSITSALNGFVPASSRGSAQSVAMNLTQGMPIAGDYENWKYAQADAGIAAVLLSQFEKGDLQALKEFTAKYGDRLNVPTFQLALSKELGAQGYADFMNALASYRASDSDTHPAHFPVTPDMQKAFALISASFATSLGGLPKGTRFGPVAKAQYEEGYDQWLKDLRAQGPQRFLLHRGLGGPSSDPSNATGYWVQSQLLMFAHDGLGQTPRQPDGRHENYFATVGADLLRFDSRNHAWGTSGSAPYFNDGLFVATPPFWDTNVYKNVHYSNDATHLNDPVWGLLVASSGSEDDATSYLTAPVQGSGDGALHGVTYLVQHRDASAADQTLIGQTVGQWGQDRSPSSSAATPISTTARQSVLMAHDYLAAYAQTVKDGHYSSLGGVSSPLPFDAFSGARVPAANILAHYIDDVDSAYSSDSQPTVWASQKAGEPYMLHMGIDSTTRHNLIALYGDLAKDRPDQMAWYSDTTRRDTHNPPAFERVIAAQIAYDQQHFAALRNDASPRPASVQAAVLNSSNFMRDFSDAVTGTWHASAADRQAFQDKIVELAKTAVEVVPVSAAAVGTDGLGADVTKSVIDKSWDAATKAIIDHIAQSAPKDLVTASADAKNLKDYLEITANQQLRSSALNSHRTIAPLALDYLQHQPNLSHDQWFTNAHGDIDWAKIKANKKVAEAFQGFLTDERGLLAITGPEMLAVQVALEHP